MACPPVTAGAVTNETGVFNGSLFTLEDAYALKQGTDFQWQWWAGLSSVAGVGARYPQNKTVKGEKWLLLTMTGGHPDDPANLTPVPPPSLGTFQAGQSVYEGTQGQPDYRVYTLSPNYAAHDTSCRQQTETPTGGSVTYTRFDDTGIEGHYDLDFGTDRVTGDFVAPNLDLTGCPARPSKVTCVSG